MRHIDQNIPNSTLSGYNATTVLIYHSTIIKNKETRRCESAQIRMCSGNQFSQLFPPWPQIGRHHLYCITLRYDPGCEIYTLFIDKSDRGLSSDCQQLIVDGAIGGQQGSMEGAAGKRCLGFKVWMGPLVANRDQWKGLQARGKVVWV